MPINPTRFKELRKQRGLSQPKLAKAAAVSQQLISQIENGVNLTTRALPQIARELGVAVSEINPDFDAEAAANGPGAPLISWVSAGALRAPDAVIDSADADIVYTSDLDPKGDWIALRVDSDSMDRISPPESVIFVNRKDRRLVANACYVIADAESGEATYKRFRPSPDRWEPVSTNPEHEPIFVRKGREPTIIGRVRKTLLAM